MSYVEPPLSEEESKDLGPHNATAEQNLLGCILWKPEYLDQVEEKFGSNAYQAFFINAHQGLYQHLIFMRDKGLPIAKHMIDQTLQGEMRRDIGGMEYVEKIKAACPTHFTFPLHLEDVGNFWTLRRAIHRAIETRELANSPRVTVEEVLGKFEASFDNSTRTDTIDVKDVLRSSIDRVQNRYNRRDQLGGVTTGLRDLDKILDGIQYGEHTLIAARPSVGKTALAMNIIEAACIKGGVPTCMVTCEMDPESLMIRTAASYSGVSLTSLRNGQLTEKDFKGFSAFTQFANNAKLKFIDGVSGITGNRLCAKIRRSVELYGTKFVVIDYLQKIKPNMRQEKRTYEVAETSNQLQALARHSKVAILTLAQLNRESDKDKGRPPRLTDLADSGQIERDADTVILMSRDKSETFLNVAKARNGETGLVKAYFNMSRTRFENATNQVTP